MPPISPLEKVLWGVSLLFSGVLVLRMYREGLHRVYLWFFVYLLVGLAQCLAVLPFDPNTNAYAWIYLASQPAIWLLYILIVLELYSLVLRNHQGIATLGRWTLMGALGLSVVVSVLTLWPDLRSATGPYPILIYYTVIERGVISSLVIFLILIVAFLVWYPIPLTRNVILHAVVYSVYFLSSTMALFVRNVTGHGVTRTVSTVLIGITGACFLMWVLFLSRRGEARTLVLRHQFRPEDEERLVKQLDAINTALLRTARKQ